MSVGSKKNKNDLVIDKDKSVDKSVSDAINEAFDNVELSTVGKLCLDARLNKGLTQEQAAALLKVRVKIIKDFEDGERIDLPGLAYKIGFVRSYARLLGLDSDLLVKEFKESLEISSFKEEYNFLTPELNKNNLLPIGAVLSVFIAVLSYTGWYYSDRSNDFKQTADQRVEDLSTKTDEIENDSYVIIEENLNAASSTPSNNLKIEKQAKVLNPKKNLNTENDKRKTNKNLEVFVSKTITDSNFLRIIKK